LERIYANSQKTGTSIFGGVKNPLNAVDGNPKTFSNLITNVGLLGIGAIWQDLNFPEIVKAGTPATIKLGKDISTLKLLSNLTVEGLDENGQPIGIPKAIGSSLLTLLGAILEVKHILQMQRIMDQISQTVTPLLFL